MTYFSRPTLTATRARQGRLGRHLLWVLLFATLLAAIGLFGAWTWAAPQRATAKAESGLSEVEARLNRSTP